MERPWPLVALSSTSSSPQIDSPFIYIPLYQFFPSFCDSLQSIRGRSQVSLTCLPYFSSHSMINQSFPICQNRIPCPIRFCFLLCIFLIIGSILLDAWQCFFSLLESSVPPQNNSSFVIQYFPVILYLLPSPHTQDREIPTNKPLILRKVIDALSAKLWLDYSMDWIEF